MAPRADDCYQVDYVEEDERRPLIAPISQSDERIPTVTKTRILIGFWLLGVCNNFGYNVMLAAAYDILEQKPGNETNDIAVNATRMSSNHLICHQAGTGVILLADILPTLIVKLTAPFFMHKISYNIRVIVCLLFSVASFILVAYGAVDTQWLSIMGVVSASLSFGFGEIVFLSFSTHFNRHSVTTWSAGTGAASLFGALTYSGLRQLDLSAQNTLLVMTVVPVLEAFSFYWLIVKPPSVQGWHICELKTDTYQEIGCSDKSKQRKSHTFKQMILLIKPLLKYMIPLMMVYLAQYFINQALFELAYFPASIKILTISDQYRWYQTLYQVGVFLSRTIGSCFTLKHLWILPIFQFVNMGVILTQVLYHYMPDDYGIWIVFAIVLWEGMIGGTCYVQTLTQISKEVSEENKEYSMGVASSSQPAGIVTSAFLAIAAHNSLCKMHIAW